MKKLIASIIALIAISASAYDVTNTVTIVSNIYNRISQEHWITNNVKNTHVNYYYTNNVYTVSNVTLLVSQQTFKTNTTVSLDVSQQAIADARAQANRAAEAATNANDFASSAASSATTAQGHSASAKDYRDEAEYYANQAHGQVQTIIDEGERQLAAVQSAGNTQTGRVTSEGDYQVGRVNSAGSSNVGSVNSAGQAVLGQINSKQQWFEQHFGQMVTNVNVNVETNIYVAVDQVARAGVSQNAEDIASLESRVGDNTQQLTTRMGTVETNIGNLNTSVSGLTTRMGTAEGRIAASVAYTTSVSNKLDQKIERVGKIYNDGTGMKDDWAVYDLYYGSLLEGRVSVNPQDPIVEHGRYESWNYKYNILSGNIEIEGIYKMNTPPDYVFRIQWARTDASGQVRYGYLPTHDSDKNRIPTGSSTSPTSSGKWICSSPEIKPYIISSDFNIYDLNSNKIGRIMRDADLNALSNWVERVFQKR